MKRIWLILMGLTLGAVAQYIYPYIDGKTIGLRFGGYVVIAQYRYFFIALNFVLLCLLFGGALVILLKWGFRKIISAQQFFLLSLTSGIGYYVIQYANASANNTLINGGIGFSVFLVTLFLSGAVGSVIIIGGLLKILPGLISTKKSLIVIVIGGVLNLLLNFAATACGWGGCSPYVVILATLWQGYMLALLAGTIKKD